MKVNMQIVLKGITIFAVIVHPVLAAEISILDFVMALRAIGSALFGLAFIWGAMKIMFSGGDKRTLDEGKNIVKNAIIGYIIIVLASFIPSMVNGSGLNLDPLVIVPLPGR